MFSGEKENEKRREKGERGVEKGERGVEKGKVSLSLKGGEGRKGGERREKGGG